MSIGVPRSTDGPRWATILLIVGAGIVSALQVGKAPAALAAVQADFGLSLAAASWLLSAFALVGALFGIVMGVAVDHLGARRLALAGLILQGVCSAIGAAAEGPMLLLAARAVEGVGFLVVSVAAPTLIVAIAPERDRGRAVAVWGVFMPVGMTLVLLATPLLAAWGWRGFWLANAVILIGYAILFAFGARALPSDRPPRRSIAADAGRTLAARGPWLLAGLMAGFSAAFFAMFGFLPSILSDRMVLFPGTSGVLTAGAIGASALGNLVCGALLSRGFGREGVLLAGFAAMSVCGFGALSEGVPGVLAYAFCVLFSAAAGLIPVAIIDAGPLHAPRPELVGATIGFIMQGNNAGLVLGPAATGALAAGFGWSAIPFFVLAVAIACGLLVAALRTSSAARLAAAQEAAR